MNCLRRFALLLAMATTVASGKCPDKPRGLTKKYGSACLEFIKDESRQPEAKLLCEQNNGHLVTIENREKQVWLESTLTEEVMWVESDGAVNVWLGVVRDEVSYPSWYLDDGSHNAHGDRKGLKYTNWDAGEPEANKDRECVVFGYSSQFKWRASICDQYPYEYQVICQYDGPDGLFTKPAVYVPVMVFLLLGLIAVIVFPYYCYKRRRALRNQLDKSREEDMFDEDMRERHIINTDTEKLNNIYPPNHNNNTVQAHFAPVTNIPPNTNSYNNFNILSDPQYRHDKPLHKDLSLQGDALLIASSPVQPPIIYGRSVSSPPNFPKPSAPPSEDFRIGIDEDDHNEDETSPLHKQRPHSVGSNNLSV